MRSHCSRICSRPGLSMPGTGRHDGVSGMTACRLPLADAPVLSAPHDRGTHRKHPQFRDHRPYRPRQIDARRPADPAHRRARSARNGRAGARFHGYRARARHHHQGADGAAELPRPRRQGLRPQPHRHARPRRLRLRGQPLARRLRGLAAGGRRQPGRRGADARQRLPGARQQSRDRAGAQQGRSAGRRARQGQAADRGRDRARRLGRDPDLGQDRAERAGGAGSDRAPAAAAQGRSPRRRSRRCWSTAGTTPISASSCCSASSTAC